MTVDLAEQAAEARAYRDKRGDDIEPVVRFYRDDEWVMDVISPLLDRDMALRAAHTAIPVVKPTEVVLWIDAHVTHGPKPDGSPWGPGEMQTWCDTQGACDQGLLTDCISVVTCNRDGVLRNHVVKYHLHKTDTGSEPAWIDDDEVFDTDDPDENLVGLIPDVLRDCFAEAKMTPSFEAFKSHPAVAGLIKDLDLGLIPPEKIMQAIEDGLIASLLGQTGYMCRLDTEAPWKRRVVETMDQAMQELIASMPAIQVVLASTL